MLVSLTLTNQEYCYHRNYDLCQECEPKDTTGFPFLKITDPASSPSTLFVVLPEVQTPPDVDNDVHEGVACDVCGMNPIRGPRFNCTMRE